MKNETHVVLDDSQLALFPCPHHPERLLVVPRTCREKMIGNHWFCKEAKCGGLSDEGGELPRRTSKKPRCSDCNGVISGQGKTGLCQACFNRRKNPAGAAA